MQAVSACCCRAAVAASNAACHTRSLHQVVVKSLPGDPNLSISLKLACRVRNLDRPKDELLERPLARIAKSAAPAGGGRQQKRIKGGGASGSGSGGGGGSGGGDGANGPTVAAAAAAANPAVVLHAGPTEDAPPLEPAAITNEQAWQQGRLLRVGQALYRVELNPPMVDRLELFPVIAFVGVPLVPGLATHFAEPAACRWRWLRRPAHGTGSGGSSWQAIPGATQRRYVPTAADVGYMLRVECTPGRSAGGGAGEAAALGEPMATDCGPVAAALPLGAAPRLALTQAPAVSPSLRVLTYNILADQYASTDAARNVIFAHCPPAHLDPAYRRPRVLAELLGLRPDVACLQARGSGGPVCGSLERGLWAACRPLWVQAQPVLMGRPQARGHALAASLLPTITPSAPPLRRLTSACSAAICSLSWRRQASEAGERERASQGGLAGRCSRKLAPAHRTRPHPLAAAAPPPQATPASTPTRWARCGRALPLSGGPLALRSRPTAR